MTDPESTPAVEPGSPPIEPASPQVVSPPSGSPDVGDLVKAILADTDFQKATQSVKDKRIAEIQTNLEEQGSDLARLGAILGKTPQEVQEAQTKLALEDMAKEYLTKQVPSQSPVGTGVDLASARTSILTQTGLTEAPTGFDDYLASLDWKDPITATLSASKWAAEQKANTNQPSAATTPPPSGSLPATTYAGMDKDELGTELIKLQREPTKNKAKRAEVLKELQDRGGTT